VLLTACGGGGGGSGSTQTPGAGQGSQPAPVGFAAPVDEMDGWIVESTPELDRAQMDRLYADLAAGSFPPIDAIVVAHQGRLVVDETLRTTTDRFDLDVGNTDPRLHLNFSVTKSIAAILVGVAIELGDLQDVNIAYLSLFPYQPDLIANWDPRKLLISLEDVLTMRLGFEWNEFDPGFSDPDNQLFSFHNEQHDWSKGLFDLPMAADPGEEFAYNTIATTSLGQAIENSQPLLLEDYAATHLLGPLQIQQVEVLRTPTGLPDMGRGLYLKTRDMAKFGQLILDDGLWNGTQVVPSEWIAQMLAIRTAFAWQEPSAHSWQITGFGYQWWLGEYEHSGIVYKTYTARGFGLQMMMVIPDLELVIAINSSGYDDAENEEMLFGLISDYLLPAAAGN
jgi:CubicO group peptidase (beta-lactamase class C family)